jgi:8-oxo-dGTP diphosphatase
VHRPRYDDWGFPKGKRDAGEQVLLTAVREVAEETGIRILLGRRLPASHYEVRGRPKRVDYWAASPAPGPQPPFTPGAETDRLAWLDLAAARGRLSYPRDVSLLDEFAAGPAVTIPLILLRHARAEDKQAWRAAGHADDQPRPLAAPGVAQAEALAEVLGCFPAAEVISSPAQRCVATVQSYAARTATPIRLEPSFAVGPHDPAGLAPPAGSAPAAGSAAPRGPGAATAARRCLEQIVAAGRPALICAHRENLPLLLGWACKQLGSETPDGPPLAHGAFWVLHISRGTLASAEQHDLGS